MTDDIYSEMYRGLPIWGPGRDRFTERAFRMLPVMERPRILDAGCGDGGPTIALARLSGGEVTGMDHDMRHLETLSSRAKEAGLAPRVAAVQGSILEMPFLDGAFDVIWAEGSIHIVGFERGLLEWRRYLRSPGFLVVHDMTWLRPDPPREIVDRWIGSFPDVNTIAGYIELIPSCGYEVIGEFALPEDFWWNDYYGPLEQRIGELRSKYEDDAEALRVLSSEQGDVDLYKKHQKWYGSGFLVMERK
jgi:SAM-dependent methyltransferase